MSLRVSKGVINIIQGTDRDFTIQIEKRSDNTDFDLTGITGANLKLRLPKEEGTLDVIEGVALPASGLTVSSPISGKIEVHISDADSALLKDKLNQNMELVIQKGAGPDFEVSKVQMVGLLNVKPMLFD